MLRESAKIVTYPVVIGSSTLPSSEFLYPALRGDSRMGWIASRASAAEAVVGRAGAFVVGLAHFRSAPEDRTLVRLLSVLLTLVVAPMKRLVSRVGMPGTDTAWPITRHASASNRLSAVRRPVWRGPAAHPLPYRAAASESPVALARAVTDETRDSHQREPARDAGRHPRGRRAR